MKGLKYQRDKYEIKKKNARDGARPPMIPHHPNNYYYHFYSSTLLQPKQIKTELFYNFRFHFYNISKSVG
jgi:hypothetical protein